MGLKYRENANAPWHELEVLRGPKGNTPVRGTDYWTDADKTEIVDEVIAEIESTTHNHSASVITGGTFGGEVSANSNGQTAENSVLRNSKLVSVDTTPTANGEIYWTYE